MFKSDKRQEIKRNKKKDMDVFNLGYPKRSVHNLSQLWGFAALLFILLVALISRNQLVNLPKALLLKDEPTNPESFIAERAWTDLGILTEFGPRVLGTYANEVLAVDFLKREISYIQQMAHKNQKIYADLQQVTGAYWLGFKPNGVTNAYRQVQNFVVKLIGKSEGKDNTTLLLNCHFDSVPGSPGASDNAANCCVMLEILRVLSKQPDVNRHTIIFLFNGAEETPLQAAHGFITQHHWADKIKAFINLDSAGSNGKEILFQSGPNQPWLIDMYQKSVYHPFGQAAGEEIFQSGIIPSDTDFRIFRDFGKIPGLDFAHPHFGYRYHTKYDHMNYLSMPVLQRTGDNILSLTKTIANSDELINSGNNKEGNKVFFDFLGLFFLSYGENLGIAINIIVALLSVWIPNYFLGKTTKGIHCKHIQKETLISFLITIISVAVSGAVCYGIAYELDLNDNTMSWFHHTIIAVMLYSCPSFLIQCILHRILSPKKESPLSLSLKVQARLNGTNLLWALLTVAMTLAGFRSAYLLMLPLFMVTVTNIVIGLTGTQNSIRKWLYLHIFGQFFHILWAAYIYYIIMWLIIPITGRSGSGQNPELTIGILSLLLTTLTTSYMVPLISLLNRTKILFFTLFSIYLIARIGFLSLTDIGFPYRDESGGFPTPQRHSITHSVRTFYHQNGKVRYTDSGFWFKKFDRNSWKTIESLVAPDILIHDEQNAACAREIFCGLPIAFGRQKNTGGLWLPGPQPIVREKGAIKLISTDKLTDSEKRLNFEISGAVQITLHIRPREKVELIKWNLFDEIPEPNDYNNGKGYLVAITHGIDAPPFNLTMIVTHDAANPDGPLLDIGLVTTHHEYHREHTPAFASMLAKLPNWAYAVPAVASVEAWTF